MYLTKGEIVNVISRLRLPLTIGVVLIHSIFIPTDVSVDDSRYLLATIELLFSVHIPQICVPMFFMISGYLYFFNVDEFNFNSYLNKCKSRFRTLLIPYLVWNILYVAVVALTHAIVPTMIDENYLNIKNFTLSDYFNCFWGISEGLPASYQLWFLRDLIIICIISPIIYYVVKFGRILAILSLLAILIFSGCSWCEPVVYFAIGAFFSIRNIRIKFNGFFVVSSIIAYVITLICMMNYVNPILSYLNLLFGVISLFYLYCNCKISVKQKSSKALFFVYCYHPLPIAALINLLTLMINNNVSVYVLIAIYFLCPVTVVLSGLVIYRFMRKYTPVLTELLTGLK